MMKRPVRKMTAADAMEVGRLFKLVCDEMAGVVPKKQCEAYVSRYTEDHLEKLLENPDSVMLVSEEGDKIAGFLIGAVSDGIGTIHWLRTHPGFRDRGYGHSLHFAAVEDFEKRGCQRIIIYVFPDAGEIVRFYEREGFSSGDTIGEEYFGIALKPMIKILRPPTEEEATKRVVLLGNAGQGIKVMSHALAGILSTLGKYVALNVTYPSSVRAGMVRGDLTFSDKPIEMPFIEKADLLLQLSPVEGAEMVKAKKIIRDREVGKILSDEYHAEEGDVEEISFKKMSLEEFKSPLFINMVALGKLLHHLGVDIEKVDFEKALPPKFLDQNIRAIKYGYDAKDE